MKQFISYVVAGILGGACVVGLQSITKEHVTQEDIRPQATPVSHIANRTSTAAPLDFVDASEKAKKAVVHIHAEQSQAAAQAERKNRRRSPFEDLFGGDMFRDDFFRSFGDNFFRPKNGMGSGVILSDDGYIVTNNHVVGFADKLTVTLSDGRKVEAKKIGTDPSSDLAVIKIELDEKLPHIAYADSDKVRVGEWVLAVGNPFSYLTSTVTAGIVSAKGRDLDIIKEERAIEEFIQTDAAVNPGNSGGALVDARGRLIGINTAIATPTGTYAGYSFAIPSNIVKRIVEDIKENGDIQRTQLGISGWDVDENLVKEKSLKTRTGFYIQEVQRGSSAQMSGLLPGDVLVKLNGKKIEKYEDIMPIVKYSKSGDVLKAEIYRRGKLQKYDITLMSKI